MGLFEANVKIGAMNNGKPAFNAEVKLLVDTGATYTTIPAEVLDRVGVIRLGEMSVRLANGTFIKKSYGGAVLEVEGRVVAATVLFGEPGDFALLGATTLEQASMAVDPVGQRLVAITAIQA
jgi:predicted aspartyl protease